jgi:hypothetical protein
MIIEFKIIPHKKQRYDTVGDYFKKGDAWQFRVSYMEDARYSLLVFLHEMIEFFLCRQAGVKIRDIDRFDQAYEESRGVLAHAPCGCKHLEESGEDPHAPYREQHVTATKCERLIAEALGIKWDVYSKAVESL